MPPARKKIYDLQFIELNLMIGSIVTALSHTWTQVKVFLRYKKHKQLFYIIVHMESKEEKKKNSEVFCH